LAFPCAALSEEKQADSMSGWENIVQNNGISIAIAGITVVFVVLAIICGFISLLPRALELLHQFAPEAEHHRSPAVESKRTGSQDEAMAAAIGYAKYLQSQSSRDS
jgi:Na+-transporting methylmalonyl-CoA/oxaloacetate decarboxylase gamma subunit